MPSLPGWLARLLIGGAALASAGLIGARTLRRAQLPLAPSAVSLGLAALLVAPLALSVISVRDGNGGGWLVQAGPSALIGGFGGGPPAGRGTPGPGFGGFGGPGMAMTFAGAQWNRLDQGLLRYLEANQGSTEYLVATPTSSYASLFILNSRQTALALGGYQGWDRILTPADLVRLVADGVARFFYLPVPPSVTRGQEATLDTTRDLVSWVQSTCSVVPPSTWGGSSSNQQLYDCAPTTA